MGSRNWHLARARRHKEVADYLGGSGDHDDWAAVALAYAAHQLVHSALSGESLAKDERHPRKHTSPAGVSTGGRGTNQLVNALFPEPVAEAYASLFEAGRRTRYDVAKLGPNAYKLLLLQYEVVRLHCELLNISRADIPTQAP